LSKSPNKSENAGGTVADQVAAFIGRSMGELLNRKDALSKQLAEVDQQIADVRQRVVRQFGSYLPAQAPAARTRKARKARSKSSSDRVVSSETREKMAAAARKRWARARANKAKAAKSTK
jgi:hypothetical protein